MVSRSGVPMFRVNMVFTILTLNVGTKYPLPYLPYNFNKSILLLFNVYKNYWMNGKQCRPRSDAAFCGT